jgi:integrase
VDVRLGDAGRKATPEGISNEEGRSPTPNAHEERSSRNKKRPGLARLAPFAQAWANAQGTRNHAKLAALEYSKEAGDRCRIEDLSPNLGNVVVQRWKHAYRESTVHVKRKELHRFLRDVVAQGAPTAIVATLARAREPEPRTVIATPDELARLQVVAGAWEKCFLAIVAGLGLRRSEACELAPANYDTNTHTITYRTKGGLTNKLPVTDELRAWFEMFGDEIENPNTPLIELVAGHKIGWHGIQTTWERLKKKARVNPQLRLHDLRRTVALRVYDRTKDIREVARLLGHRSPQTTLKYLMHHEPVNLTPLLNELRVLPAPDWKN